MKKQKGITLVALIITIIVMLILAGVAISLVTGEKGVMTQAETANAKMEQSSIEDIIETSYYYDKNNPGKLDYTKTKEAIENNLKSVGYTVEFESGTQFPINVKTTGKTGTYNYVVLKDGNMGNEIKKEYKFTLNQLKEGGYREGDSGGIAFDNDYVWNNVITENLCNNEMYAFEMDEDVIAFEVESADGTFSNYWDLREDIENENISEGVQFIILATYNKTIDEFEVPVFTHDGKSTDTAFNDDYTIDEFLEEYGDIELKFIEVK